MWSIKYNLNLLFLDHNKHVYNWQPSKAEHNLTQNKSLYLKWKIMLEEKTVIVEIGESWIRILSIYPSIFILFDWLPSCSANFNFLIFQYSMF